MNPPKVKIDKVKLEENVYVDRNGKVFSALKLIEHSKNYKTFDLPLAGLDLRLSYWTINDLDDFVHHAKRCSDANLKYPIILDEFGSLADGCHRVAKAIVMGKKTIKAIRLETMPEPDRIEEKEND